MPSRSFATINNLMTKKPTNFDLNKADMKVKYNHRMPDTDMVAPERAKQIQQIIDKKIERTKKEQSKKNK